MNSDILTCFKNSKYKSIKHSTYFNSYEHFFSSYRGKNITFIEIGILNGGSLFMWREYFGPQARIIGIDLNPNAKKWEKEGFEIFIGDQSNDKFWREIKTKIKGIDIVLDDGGHTYDQQIITTESLLGAMNDGGIIVIEDTHTSYEDGFGPKKYSFINYVKKKIDQINFRFSNLSNSFKPEKRIWSVEIVESMVAFKINKTESNKISSRISNNGKDNPDDSIEYRHHDKKEYFFFLNALHKLKFLRIVKYLPFSKKIFHFLRKYLINKNFKSKAYFK